MVLLTIVWAPHKWHGWTPCRNSSLATGPQKWAHNLPCCLWKRTILLQCFAEQCRIVCTTKCSSKWVSDYLSHKIQCLLHFQTYHSIADEQFRSEIKHKGLQTLSVTLLLVRKYPPWSIYSLPNWLVLLLHPSKVYIMLSITCFPLPKLLIYLALVQANIHIYPWMGHGGSQPPSS